MNGTDRVLQVVGLAVAPERRPRFLEEWRGDLAAARALGLPPWTILVAALRVAGLLTWFHLRRAVPHRRLGVVAAGSGLGLLLVLTDCTLEPAVPFVVLVLTGWSWQRVRRWIDTGR